MSELGDENSLPEATITGDIEIGTIHLLSGGEIIFDGGLTINHKILNQLNTKNIQTVVVPHGASIRFKGHVSCGQYLGGGSQTTPVKLK